MLGVQIRFELKDSTRNINLSTALSGDKLPDYQELATIIYKAASL